MAKIESKSGNTKHHPLYESLCAIVGSKYVADEDFAVLAYRNDSGPFTGSIPGIVVRPGATEEVSEIVRLANHTRIPVISRGGGVSIFGFPPGEAGRNVVIDLTRLDKIIDINEDNMTVTAECGITLSELGTKVQEKGFSVNLMLMPYYANTLGGTLAGVSGGGWPLDCNTVGSNWRYVLGLKIVLPNGSVVETGGGAGTNVYRRGTFMREAGAPDVTGMFIGDGGTFGVKTEATIQIFPSPEVIEAGSFFFSSFEDIWKAMSELMTIDPFPYTQLVGFDPRGLSLLSRKESQNWCLLYSTKGGSGREVGEKINKLKNTCHSAGGKEGGGPIEDIAAQFATGVLLREMGRFVSLGLWAWLESVVSKESFPQYFMNCRSLIDKRYKEGKLKQYGAIRFDMIIPYLRNACFGGTNIYYPDEIPELREKMIEISKEYSLFAVTQGGSLWGHQGHGAEIMASYWSPTFYSFMQTLKRSLDPNDILNPGLWRM